MSDLQTHDADTTEIQRFKAEAWPLLPSLLRVAMMLTADEHQAQDLAQETMMRAYRHIGSFKAGTNMKAWLMTILRRTHIDLYRRESRQVSAGSLDAMTFEPADTHRDIDADPAWSQPDDLLNRFDDPDIEDALRKLPESMRWTLLLLDVEQMSVSETAQTLDVAAGTIKSRASRARAQLRAELLPVAHQRGWLTSPSEHLP